MNRLGIEEVDKETLGGSSHPHAQRRGRRRGRDRGRGVRPRPRVPVVPAELGRRAPAARRADRRPRTRRREPAPRDPRERRRVYKVRAIVEAVVDTGSFLEIGARWGRSAVTGLARLDGWPVAVLANDPYHYAGGWTADASRKVERFVDLAETFRLPVVHLVDNPGLRHRHRGRAAGDDPPRRPGARGRVPGHGAVVLGDPAQGLRRRRRGAPERVPPLVPVRVAVGRVGLAPARGRDRGRVQGAARGGRRPGRAARRDRDPPRHARDPFKTAEVFLVEDIVDPRETRPRLCEFANLAAPRRARSGPPPAPRP